MSIFYVTSAGISMRGRDVVREYVWSRYIMAPPNSPTAIRARSIFISVSNMTADEFDARVPSLAPLLRDESNV